VNTSVPTTRAWIQVHGASCAEIEDEVRSSLEAAGVRLEEPGDSDGAGVLLFEALSDDLLRVVHRAGRDRLEQVAAVGVGVPLTLRETSKLLATGAAEVFSWNPTKPAEAIAARLERWASVEEIARSPLVSANLIGVSASWRRVLREVIEAARYTDVPLLLIGESGTGKELVARLVHALSPPRRPTGRGDLVVLDCAAVPVTLSGSAFFGHERGSFTGATGSREGAFALADGGTLFLDEIGELPLPLQAELLRAVQEGTYKPIGSDRYRKTNFRLVCATNRDLLEGEHEFRRDFYYRIAGWTCRLPPLHERPEDIPVLTRRFISELRPDKPPDIDPAVQDLLVRRDYPGNARELRHLVSRIALRHVGPGPITLGDLPEDERPAGDLDVLDWRDEGFERAIRRALAAGVDLRQITAGASATAIALAVEAENGNLQRASSKLGVTARALQLRRARSRNSGPGAPVP
jgi:transcriptional regulator with GAF, ATPase, and Fis domain